MRPRTTSPPLPKAASRLPAAVTRVIAADTSPGKAAVVARQSPITRRPLWSMAMACVLANVTPPIGNSRNPPLAKVASGTPSPARRATTAIRPRPVPNGGPPSTAPASRMLEPLSAIEYQPPGKPRYAPLATSTPPLAKPASRLPSGNRRAAAGMSSSTAPAIRTRPCASSAIASARDVRYGAGGGIVATPPVPKAASSEPSGEQPQHSRPVRSSEPSSIVAPTRVRPSASTATPVPPEKRWGANDSEPPCPNVGSGPATAALSGPSASSRRAVSAARPKIKGMLLSLHRCKNRQT